MAAQLEMYTTFRPLKFQMYTTFRPLKNPANVDVFK